MNRMIHSLLKSRSKDFKNDEAPLYKKAKYDNHKAIRDAERIVKQAEGSF